MISSDSEDDCYGNATKKFQNILKEYKEDKIDTAKLLKHSSTGSESIKSHNEITDKSSNISANNEVLSSNNDSLYEDDVTLDEIIALNSSQTQTRGRKTTKRKSTRIANARKRGRGKTFIENNSPNAIDSVNQYSSTIESQEPEGSVCLSNSSARGRTSQRSRGRARIGNRVRGSQRIIPDFTNIPTYSVGNTDEYPDYSDNVDIFSHNKQLEVVEDPLDDNEELSIKVYWQSSEIVKFTIRRYQKLSQLFDYFSKKASVTIDKILLTYNDKILKPSDTPDKIDYNIAKIIDGGIANSVPITIDDDECIESGINLKFQCQNVKKPFQISVKNGDTLRMAMMKCAEHFDKPLNMLKFEFDGDIITGGMTPDDLELEGGECIDVKIAC